MYGVQVTASALKLAVERLPVGPFDELLVREATGELPVSDFPSPSRQDLIDALFRMGEFLLSLIPFPDGVAFQVRSLPRQPSAAHVPTVQRNTAPLDSSAPWQPRGQHKHKHTHRVPAPAPGTHNTRVSREPARSLRRRGFRTT
jgi:hypothetical protein